MEECVHRKQMLQLWAKVNKGQNSRMENDFESKIKLGFHFIVPTLGYKYQMI
jgi:hypothetical protein